MKAILLVDHGSRKREANDMLLCMANLVQAMAGPGVIVRPAHMELSEPSIAAGFASCAEAGATGDACRTRQANITGFFQAPILTGN